MDERTVTVSRSEFAQALKTLQVAVTGRNAPEFLVRCEPGALIMQVGGASARLTSEGGFPGQARLSAKAIKSLSLALPDEDPLPISRHPERLGIGNLRLQCHWDEFSNQIPVEALPINADDLDYLRLGQKMSQRDIEKSGYGPAISAVRQKLQGRIEQAYILLKPYGISMDDILKIVEQAIKENDNQ